MEIALMMCKDDHTPKDLRLLAQAPYFDAHLIRQSTRDQRYTPDRPDVFDADQLRNHAPEKSEGRDRDYRRPRPEPSDDA